MVGFKNIRIHSSVPAWYTLGLIKPKGGGLGIYGINSAELKQNKVL
ncbi:MAG: hypothetical protein ACPGLV_09395 [Bacteroidia bacterium]